MKAEKPRKPRTYQGGCYQHPGVTQYHCEMCRIWAEIDGLPMPVDPWRDPQPNAQSRPTDAAGSAGAEP